MADGRFTVIGVDNRFPSPGVDVEHENYPLDGRFPTPGVDTRFEGGYPGGGQPSVDPPEWVDADVVAYWDAEDTDSFDVVGTDDAHSTYWDGATLDGATTHRASVQSVSADNNPERVIDSDGYRYFKAGPGGNTQAGFRVMAPTGTVYSDYIAVVRSVGAPPVGTERFASANNGLSVAVGTDGNWDVSSPGDAFLGSDPATSIKNQPKVDSEFFVVWYTRDGGGAITIERILEAGNATMWGQSVEHDAGLYALVLYSAQLTAQRVTDEVMPWVQAKWALKFSPSSSVEAVLQPDNSVIFETSAEGDHTFDLLTGMRGAGSQVVITDEEMRSGLNEMVGPGYSGTPTAGNTLTALSSILAVQKDLFAIKPIIVFDWVEANYIVGTGLTHEVATESEYRGLSIRETMTNPDQTPGAPSFIIREEPVIDGDPPRLRFDGVDSSLAMMSTPEDVYEFCYAFSVTPETAGQVVGNGALNISFRSTDGQLRVLATYKDHGSVQIFAPGNTISDTFYRGDRHSFIVSMSALGNSVTNGGANFAIWHHTEGVIMSQTVAGLGNLSGPLKFNSQLGGPSSDRPEFYLEEGFWWGMVGQSINVEAENTLFFNPDGSAKNLTATNGAVESLETPGRILNPYDTTLTSGSYLQGWRPVYDEAIANNLISVVDGLPEDAPQP